MKTPTSQGLRAVFLAAALAATTAGAQEPGKADVSDDATGAIETFNVNGHTNTKGAFFQSLGTNGRACFTCHQPDQGWTVTPAGIRDRFDDTRGRDPIFRANDGSNCEGADISTLGKRRAAFSTVSAMAVLRAT